MGVTQDLSERLVALRRGAGWRRIAHPELLHVEQHDNLADAHRRLQDIRRRWRGHSICHTFPAPDPLAVTSDVIAQVSPH